MSNADDMSMIIEMANSQAGLGIDVIGQRWKAESRGKTAGGMLDPHDELLDHYVVRLRALGWDSTEYDRLTDERRKVAIEQVQKELTSRSRSLLTPFGADSGDAGYPRVKMWVGPALAKLFLATVRNARNAEGLPVQRPSSPVVIREYTQKMKDGDWRLSPDPIIFDVDWFNRNGMHRLKAVIASGTEQEFLVEWGWDVDVFEVMDKQHKRTVAHSLHMRGNLNTTQLASAAGVLYGILTVPNVYDWAELRPTEEQKLRAVVEHPLIRDAVRWCSGKQDRKLQRNILAACRVACAEAAGSWEATADWFDRLREGRFPEEDDPGQAVRMYITSASGALRQGERLPRAGFHSYLILKAWNATIAGETYSKISYRPNNITIPKPRKPRG